ncbi:MAG TPA: division/cell wall cluster transcriptional repressor MraZ [bacterium]|nr:division/cell wall cluster transcriptional repressor MraZ [bacterium]
MFRGEYHYTLDDKGRVVLPPKFRQDLGEAVIVTRGMDDCIWVYPRQGWEAVEDKLRTLPIARRGFQRFLLAAAQEVELDRQGRIILPEALREYAAIGREVVVVGLIQRLEIWSEERWKKAVAKAQREAAKVAQEIDVSL